MGLRAHLAGLLSAGAMAALLRVGAASFIRLFTSDTNVHGALGDLMPLFCALQLLSSPACIFDGIFLGAAEFDYSAPRIPCHACGVRND